MYTPVSRNSKSNGNYSHHQPATMKAHYPGGTWYQVPGSLPLVPWYQQCGTWYQVPSETFERATWYLVPFTMYSGVHDMPVPGTGTRYRNYVAHLVVVQMT
jgi:hypothetical protein